MCEEKTMVKIAKSFCVPNNTFKTLHFFLYKVYGVSFGFESKTTKEWKGTYIDMFVIYGTKISSASYQKSINGNTQLLI